MFLSKKIASIANEKIDSIQAQIRQNQSHNNSQQSQNRRKQHKHGRR
ncbi:hypothetical protein [Campylobacter devanensis]|nr:hypothetical protein [Campylobacter lanienae]